MKKIVATLLTIISAIGDIYAFATIIDEGLVINTAHICIIIIVNLFTFGFAGLLVYKSLRLKFQGNLKIEGINLNVISQKNLTRKKIKNLSVDKIIYDYSFFNNGFDAFIRFSGKCRKKCGSVKSISLNFSGDANQTFDSIDAFAYDLINDPYKKEKIIAVSGDGSGLNKEVIFNFTKPLKKDEKFDYMFHFKWKNCVNPDKDYIAAIPPFKYCHTNCLELNVRFEGQEVTSFNTYVFKDFKYNHVETVNPVIHDSCYDYNSTIPIDDDFNFGIAIFNFKSVLDDKTI